MPRKAARISQADIARALRAVSQSGVSMGVEVSPDGTLRIYPVEPVATKAKLDKVRDFKL